MREKRQNANGQRTSGRSTRANAVRRKTDSKRLAANDDKSIRAAVRSDPDAAPIAGADWFRRAKLHMPQPKQPVSIRLDRDVMQWFQKQGRGYQTRINAVLRAYVEGHRQS